MRYRYDQMHNVLVDENSGKTIQCSEKCRDTFQDGQFLEDVEFALFECDFCDGCGWYEGGKSLNTTCEKCAGTGALAIPNPPISKPPIPDDQGQNELAKEIFDLFCKYAFAYSGGAAVIDDGAIRELKLKYTISKRKP